MFNGDEIEELSTFEKFIKGVIKQIVSNLRFDFVDHDVVYSTLNRISEKKLTQFIQNTLTQLPTQIIERLNAIDDEALLNNLIVQVAGSGRREPQINIYSGYGLHFTGLTKLCYDSAHVYKLYRQHSSFWSQFFLTFSFSEDNSNSVLHFTEYALANIQNPLEMVLNMLDSSELIEKQLPN